MKTALFPGSFDPFTIGHLDVLCSAVRLFDRVVVAVGYNSSKKGLFSLESRLDIIRESISGLPEDICEKIIVDHYEGLTIEYCKKNDIKFIIRGLRTTTDFELESVVAQANKKMSPEISSIFIPASQEYSFISSTVVRDVIINGGDASIFLAKSVDLTKKHSSIAER